jgi:hypothetical protein
MPFSLQVCQEEVLNILQKDPSYQGFYTSDKCKRAINESLTYVAARMMMEGEGWRQKIAFVTTTANTAAYTLPTETSIINSVRYLYNDVYVPLTYDDQSNDTQIASSSGLSTCPWRYRLVGNQLVFNPVPELVGTNYLQLEYTTYPTLLVNNSDQTPQEIDQALYYYLVYRSAGILVAQSGNAQPEWQLYEMQWFNAMEQIISKRLRVHQVIGEFGCY